MLGTLYCLCGKSASGKTTIAKLLEERYGHKQIYSYTTRPPRHEGEIGHTFISEEIFDNLKDIIAHTVYNGYKYCTTKEQLDMASIYVVDPYGVETLLENYQTDRKIVVLYFDSSVKTRIDRMTDRHDSDSAIIKRLYYDEAFDWYRQLDKLVWDCKNNKHRDVELYKINANEDIENVLKQVLYYIKDESE